MERDYIIGVRGAKSTEVICFWIALFVGCSMGIQAHAAALTLSDQWGDMGSTVIFDVSVDSAPNDVVALGFEVRYDPSILRYEGYTAGYLVQGFDFFNANNLSPGTVRVGGFVADAHKIDKSASGTLACLTFEVIGHDDCQVRLVQLKDGIKTWSTGLGLFTGDHTVEQESDPSTSYPDQVDPRLIGSGGSHSTAQLADSPKSANATLNDTYYSEDTYPAQAAPEIIEASDIDYSSFFNPKRNDSDLIPPRVEEVPARSKSVRAGDYGRNRGGGGSYRQKNDSAKHKNAQKVLPVGKAKSHKDPKVAQVNMFTAHPEKAHTGGWQALLGFLAGCVCWEFMQRVRRKLVAG